ncbi:class I SAM-dependent methyltransferase [Haladaptatus caseinilyticus]|uniref:class I SAM-dependent methyltransferase n=1 Tax=Haladaptatus caseinilyticus TaxID=2993314 RepID=UPI00224B51B7|nr:class I SAM-dependent methyltransferase [Haladaptatus caseinilyticus]
MADDDLQAKIDPANYYDDLGEGEWERLQESFKNSLEFENTTDYLSQYLPESGHVLDAGGAAGRYSIWLAERGYDVTLLDLSAEQVAIAKSRVAERDLESQVTIQQGDIRDLPFSETRFDATLCLGGPLSHIISDDERSEAIRELNRVMQSSAPVFVSVMGFVSVVQNLIKSAAHFEAGVRQLPEFIETATYSAELAKKYEDDDPAFVECHFFRAAELRNLLEKHEFAVEVVAGLEGPASNFEAPLEEIDADAQKNVTEVVRKLREDPTVADLSNHILAVGRVG